MYRNKGFGSKILANIKRNHPKHTISLFVKNDGTDESKRREAFYLRNGFEYSDIEYAGKMKYRLMTYGNKLSKEKLNRLIKKYSLNFASLDNKYKVSTTSTLKL